jgi:hypothetical protein
MQNQDAFSIVLKNSLQVKLQLNKDAPYMRGIFTCKQQSTTNLKTYDPNRSSLICAFRFQLLNIGSARKKTIESERNRKR